MLVCHLASHKTPFGRLESLNALFYPFHLCHERTLHQLLQTYQQIHFRDYKALQLSPLAGTIAYSDRMGDTHSHLVETGRIVQGHSVNGALSSETELAVNLDLRDPTWRSAFHEGLKKNPQFQRGLVPFCQDAHGNSTGPTDPAALCRLQEAERESAVYDVDIVRILSRKFVLDDEKVFYEYGMAFIKTSASLQYTIQLCHEFQLIAVTDSFYHHQLLERTCRRERIALANAYITRQGY